MPDCGLIRPRSGFFHLGAKSVRLRFSKKNQKSDDNATSIEQEKEAKIGQKKGIGIYYRYSSMEKSRTCVI